MAERLYRSMQNDREGKPRTGQSARRLGARPRIDIPLEADGKVLPETGGMSVSPGSPRNLPSHRRPPEWGGTGKDPVWEIGSEELPSELTYRADPDDPDRHGFVEPTMRMHFDAYEQSLEGTQILWEVASP